MLARRASLLPRGARPCFVASRVAPRLASRGVPVVFAAKQGSPAASKSQQYQPTSARDAIERGTEVFKNQNNLDEAVRLYRVGLEMQPNDDEARAALYNLGCALTKQKKFSEAVEAIERAINDYGLKLIVALRVRGSGGLRRGGVWCGCSRGKLCVPATPCCM